jgi:two-component system response regulator GlrR
MPEKNIMTRVRTDLQGGLRAQLRRFTLKSKAMTSSVSSTRDLVLGSSSAADVTLDADDVSKLHARFESVEQGVRLTDLGSTNGTYVGDLRINSVLLSRKTTIRLGHTVVKLALEDDYEDAELAADPSFGDLRGESVAMRRLFAYLARFAAADAPVLLLGESGTGKELAAEAIHSHSHRRDAPLVVVDCGSLPATLIESELFGHERGSFTGATSARKGAFESATGGTLFLDEIGELELSLQSRLLRAVESQSIRRIGASKSMQVDVRIIAATNRDLPAMISSGDFREDLYFRLNVLNVRLPPLRERGQDYRLLAKLFAEEASQTFAKAHPEVLTDEVLDKLVGRSWPGNVRELKNFVDRAVLLGPRGLEVADAGQGDVAWINLPFQEAREAAVREFERQYVQAAVQRSGGNVAAAARSAGVHRGYLFRLLRRHDIDRE